MKMARVVSDADHLHIGILNNGEKKWNESDKEAITELESRLSAESTTASEKAYHQGALFLYHTGEFKKAKQYNQKYLEVAPTSAAGICLNAMIDLASGRESVISKAGQQLEGCLDANTRDTEVLSFYSDYDSDWFFPILTVVNRLILLNRRSCAGFTFAGTAENTQMRWKQATFWWPHLRSHISLD
jgi:hypothetical protein